MSRFMNETDKTLAGAEDVPVLLNADGSLFDDEPAEIEPPVSETPSEAPATRFALRYVAADYAQAPASHPVSTYLREVHRFAKGSARRYAKQIIAEGRAWGDEVEVQQQVNTLATDPQTGLVVYKDVLKELVLITADGVGKWQDGHAELCLTLAFTGVV